MQLPKPNLRSPQQRLPTRRGLLAAGAGLAVAGLSCRSSLFHRASDVGSPATRPPNIVVILADDLGYGDLSCYGSKTIQTPNIDRLAAEGMRFTDFYVPAAICTPARAAMLTGQYPIRNGMTGLFWPHSQDGIGPDDLTIAELLKTRGYATGLIGKWHLGHQPQHLPMRHGFEYWYGMPWPNDQDNRHPLAKVFKQDWPPLPLYRNAQLPGDPAIDGENLVPVLAGAAPRGGQDFYFFTEQKITAVRSGRWKLQIEPPAKGSTQEQSRHLLFDLLQDIGETRDLAAGRPEVVAELLQKADQFLKSLSAVPAARK